VNDKEEAQSRREGRTRKEKGAKKTVNDNEDEKYTCPECDIILQKIRLTRNGLVVIDVTGSGMCPVQV